MCDLIDKRGIFLDKATYRTLVTFGGKAEECGV